MNVKPPELDNEPATLWHWKLVKRWAFNLYEYPRHIDLIVFTMSYLEELN